MFMTFQVIPHVEHKLRIGYPFNYCKIRLNVKVLKARNRVVKCSYRFEIWQPPRQRCRQDTCQISEQLKMLLLMHWSYVFLALTRRSGKSFSRHCWNWFPGTLSFFPSYYDSLNLWLRNLWITCSDLSDMPCSCWSIIEDSHLYYSGVGGCATDEAPSVHHWWLCGWRWCQLWRHAQ